MSIKKLNRHLKNFLKKFDLFPTNQFIKYNKQSQFTTATGGFVSFALIILILALFASKGLDTVNRINITSATSYTIDAEPPLATVVAGPKGGFMFAIGVYGLNLNDPTLTYFDITLYQNVFSPIFNTISSVQIPLIKCTQAHFNFNKDILSLYNSLNLNQSLCPPLDQTFQLSGRVSSQIYKQLSINVLPCNSTKSANCANSSVLTAAQISTGGSFTLAFPVISTIVNANDQNYLQTYLQDRNYFYFTRTAGVRASAFIQQYTINTDVSIMPYVVQNTETVTAIPELFASQNVEVGTSNVYAQVSFSKSSRSTTYTRSFDKIDTLFSYIGGLLGSALGAFFLLKSYSEKAFLIDLASKILVNEKEEISLKHFNFFHNIGMMFKQILEKICINVDWQRGEYYIKSIQQMDEQLDICLIIKKLAFLQQAISTIFSNHQLDTLYLKDKNTLVNIEQLRKKLNMSNILIHANQHQEMNSDMISDDVMSSQLVDNGDNKEALERIKNNLLEVIKESRQHDKVSARIIKKIDQKMLQKAGIMNQSTHPLADEKEKKEIETDKKQVRKNAVANDFQVPQKEPAAFEFIEDED